MVPDVRGERIGRIKPTTVGARVFHAQVLPEIGEVDDLAGGVLPRDGREGQGVGVCPSPASNVVPAAAAVGGCWPGRVVVRSAVEGGRHSGDDGSSLGRGEDGRGSDQD